MRRWWLATAALLATLLVGAACSGGSSGNKDAGAFPSVGAGLGKPVADARLAIARDQRLMVRGKDGNEQSLLRTPADTFPAYPMWSPDGKTIAYVQSMIFTGKPGQDWGGDVYTVDASGANNKLLWKHDQPGAEIAGISWLPDGKALLIGYRLTLIKDGKYQGQEMRVERLDLATGQHTKLVDGAVFPSMTREGTRMAYMAQDTTGGGGVFVSNADGSGAKQVVELGPKFAAILGPRISPDGSKVCFAAVSSQASAPATPRDGGRGSAGLARLIDWLLPRRAEAHGLPMDVWCANVADGTVTRITNLNEDEPYPAWAPDGQTIVIFATGGLYEVKPDGTDLKKLGPGSFGGQADVK